MKQQEVKREIIPIQLREIVLPALQRVAEEDHVSAAEINKQLGLSGAVGVPEDQWNVIKALLLSPKEELRKDGFLAAYGALLNVVVADQTSEALCSYLSQWKDTVIEAATTLAGEQAIVISDNVIQLKSSSNITSKEIQDFLALEQQLADWFIGLAIYHAVSFRYDLSELEIALEKLVESRSEIKIVASSGRRGVSQHSLRPVSYEKELAFLGEIKSSVEKSQSRLEQEHLPLPLSQMLQGQIMQPVALDDIDSFISSLDLAKFAQLEGVPQSECGSVEEIVEDFRVRAARILLEVNRYVCAFYERAWSEMERCADLEQLTPPSISKQSDILRLLIDVESELKILIPHTRPFQNSISDLQAAIFEKFEGNWKDPTFPVFHLHLISPEHIIGDLPVGIMVHLSWIDYENDFSTNDDDETPEDVQGESDSQDKLSGDEEPIPVEEEANLDSTVEAIAEVKEDGDEELDVESQDEEVFEPGEDQVVPMCLSYLVVRGDTGRDFYEYADAISKWFSSLESLIRNGSQKSETAEIEHLPWEETEGDVALMEKPSNTSWRYFGLSQDQCQEAFRGVFGIVETFYPHIWSLIPDRYKAELSIPEIDEYSISDLAIDTLKLLQNNSNNIEKLSGVERRKIRTWLDAFGRNAEVTTADLLLSCADWVRIPPVFNGIESWDNPFYDALNEHPQVLQGEYLSPSLHLISVVLDEKAQANLMLLLESSDVIIDGWTPRFLECVSKFPAPKILEGIKHFRDMELGKEDRNGRKIGKLRAEHWTDEFGAAGESLPRRLRSCSSSVWENITRAIQRGQI